MNGEVEPHLRDISIWKVVPLLYVRDVVSSLWWVLIGALKIVGFLFCNLFVTIVSLHCCWLLMLGGAFLVMVC